MATTRLTFTIPADAVVAAGLEAMLGMEGQTFPFSWAEDGTEFTELARVEKVQQSGDGVLVTMTVPDGQDRS